MQTADLVLGILEQASRKNSNYESDRLYRNFFNVDFYLNAYARTYAKEGNMTPGTDGKTIDGFSIESVQKVIDCMRQERYYFKPARRTYIPKKRGGKRPLGIPATMDKLVQEIARSILESIYEPQFSRNSHGFRPNHSCHTALKQIKREWTGVKWVIEGDIKGFFDNIDHDVLIGIMKRKVKDGRFVELIYRMLKAGYMEDWVYYKTYSGTPQGGTVSPLLANIYLDQLDKFVEEVIVPKYETNASKRRYNPPYYKIGASIAKLTKKIDQLEKGNKEREELIKQIKSLKLSRRGLKTLDPMDENFVRIKYVRYADDFVIGVIGSKQLAQQIKQEVAEFLQNTLKLNLSDEKTLITNFGSKTKPVKFLGYEIYSGAANDYIVKKKNGHVTRAINEIPRLRLSGEVITGRLNQITKNGKPIHRAELIPYDLAETIAKYSAEIRGLYNYYRLADNVAYQLNRYRWYHRTSLLKTIAAKMKISCQVARRKYNVNGTIGYIIQREPKKHNIIVKYYDEGFQKDDYVEKANENPDNISIMVRRTGRNGVIKRLLALECEQCGYTGNNVTYEVHHVRKLKDLKKMYKGKNMPPKWVQVMIARNRKTMVLCKPCHDQIHSVGR